MPTSGGMLGDVQNNLLQEALGNLGPEWQDQSLPARMNEAKNRLRMMEQIDDTSEFALKNHEHAFKAMEEMEQNFPQAANLSAKRQIFNLLKVSQFEQAAPQSPQPPMDPAMSAQPSMPKFTDASELRDFLSQMDPDSASAQFGDLVSISPELEQIVDDAINRFFESDNPQRQLELSSMIFNALPQSARAIPNEMEGDTQVNGIEQTVEASNNAIREAAVRMAKSAKFKTAYNGSKLRQKIAQHKGLENVMMFGPDQVRIDPFTGQLVSKWHIYERNKGYGVRMDDALDVDFEAIWRGNVMDKYSQPYRNAEGELVGGYINKRFEVDRMMPEGNSYHLLPGEKRRAYLPQYRSTEARLQNMRSEASDGDHQPTYLNKDKPTDWNREGTEFAPFNFKKIKQASSDSKKKSNLKTADFFDMFMPKKTQLPKVTAQIGLPQGGQEKDLNSMPGEEPMKGGPQCKNCGTQLPNPASVSNQRKGNLTNCPTCKSPINFGGKWTNPFNQQKQQTPFNQNIQITPNMNRAAQIAMPTDKKVVMKAVPDSMTRRTKPYEPQMSSRPALPQSRDAVLLSDDHADNTDRDHLENVEHSANALCL